MARAAPGQRMMTGLTRADAGHALIDGRPFVQLPNPQRVVGTLLDPTAMHPGRSGRAALRLAARLAGAPAGRADAMLTAVGLSGAAGNRRIAAHSLGMRQRRGLAQALVGDPYILILDEPANGLDPEGIAWMRTLLREFAERGGTVLLPSHLLTEVEATVDRLVMIVEGRQSLPAYMSLASTSLAFLFPIVVILALTSEWSQRNIIQTFTQEPRRVRVLAAKVLSGLILAVPVMTLAIAFSAAALAISAALGRHVDWHLGGALLLGFALSALLYLTLGMAFAVLLQNTAAAIVMLYIPTVAWGLLGSLAGIRSLRDWLDPAQAFNWVSDAAWAGHWFQILTATAVWVVLPLVLGAARTARREVK